jgi:hypothetical protein
MADTKSSPYDGRPDGESPDIHRLAEAILAAIQSRVDSGPPGLTPAEERDIAFGEAALAAITAGLSLEASPITVTGISPTAGKAGETVTISGTNFTPGATVSFGAAQATPGDVNVVSAKEIRAKAPPGSKTVPVTVDASAPTSAGQFTYQ